MRDRSGPEAVDLHAFATNNQTVERRRKRVPFSSSQEGEITRPCEMNANQRAERITGRWASRRERAGSSAVPNHVPDVEVGVQIAPFPTRKKLQANGSEQSGPRRPWSDLDSSADSHVLSAPSHSITSSRTSCDNAAGLRPTHRRLATTRAPVRGMSVTALLRAREDRLLAELSRSVLRTVRRTTRISIVAKVAPRQ
jgi:hypothetical protein